jgi:RHS repeat-associated protein
VYGLGLIGQETGGEYTSYHFDLRGSTVALTNNQGQVTERFQYSPYGLLLGGNAEKTPFLFNGMYGVMTDSNGLYYMRARFYRPEMRRFVNQDVLVGNVADGQTLNRYAFVTGKPISLIDPFGLFGQEDALSLALDFTPIVGSCKGILEFIIGKDPITGESIPLWIAVIGIIPGGKYLTRAGKAGVALDTNALVAALEYGDILKIDAALKGRIPLVSRQAVREFLERGDIEALRQFLSERGGRVGLSATEKDLKALLALIAKLPAKPSPRKIGKGDANVLGCAVKEGVPLITNDRKFCNLVNDLGYKGEKF